MNFKSMMMIILQPHKMYFWSHITNFLRKIFQFSLHMFFSNNIWYFHNSHIAMIRDENFIQQRSLLISYLQLKEDLPSLLCWWFMCFVRMKRNSKYMKIIGDILHDNSVITDVWVEHALAGRNFNQLFHS